MSRIAENAYGDTPAPDLFSHTALARRADPKTSRAAADSLVATLPDLERSVLNIIVNAGDHGATLDDIAAATGLDKVTASPRMRPLCNKGLVKTKLDGDGNPVTRPGNSGRGQTVWIAVLQQGAE